MGWLSVFLVAALGAAGSVFDTAEQMQPPGAKENAAAARVAFYRYAFHLPEAPVSARCAFTAQGQGRLYLNSHLAAFGPTSPSKVAQPYLWLDVTEFLTAGNNVIAVEARAVEGSGVGVLARIEVQYPDGSLAAVLSGPEWRCLSPNAFLQSSDKSEQVDLRAVPQDWHALEFDHSAWPAPIGEPAPSTLVQQVLPPVLPGRALPKTSTKLPNGALLLDFGGHLLGTAHVGIDATDGQKLTVTHAEQADKLGAAAPVEFTLGEGRQVAAFFEPRGFRFLQISGAATKPEVWAETYRYPIAEGAGYLSTPNTALRASWQLASTAIPWCATRALSESTNLDARSSLDAARTGSRGLWWLAADARPATQFLWNTTLAPYAQPWHKTVAAPGAVDTLLSWPDMLWQHYINTGDTALLERLAGSELESLFAHLKSIESESGLLHLDGAINNNIVTQVRYVEALMRLGQIRKALNQEHTEYALRARKTLTALKQSAWDTEKRVYKGASDVDTFQANVLAAASRVEPDLDPASVIEAIRVRGLADGPRFAGDVIEACFRAGDPVLGWTLLSGDDKASWREMQRIGATTATGDWAGGDTAHLGATSPVHLLIEEVFGMTYSIPGGSTLHIAPPSIPSLPELHLTVAHPGGAIQAHYTPKQGYRFRLPQGVTADINKPEGLQVTTSTTPAPTSTPMSSEDWQRLASLGWADRAGGGLGVWIDIARQRFVLVENGVALWNIPCATATAGAGCKVGSNQTPTGWHRVAEKLGAGAPWGQVFRSRKATKEIWSPGMDTKEDLVLTRVLWLEGLEPGVNKGKTKDGVVVDSKERFIYIHGTNGEDKIGTPSSHGCIRLYNDDVILAFERIPEGTPVLITE